MLLDRLLIQVQAEKVSAFVSATQEHLRSPLPGNPQLDLLQEPDKTDSFWLIERHFDDEARAEYKSSAAWAAWNKAIKPLLAASVQSEPMTSVFSVSSLLSLSSLAPAPLPAGALPEPEAPRRPGDPPRLPGSHAGSPPPLRIQRPTADPSIQEGGGQQDDEDEEDAVAIEIEQLPVRRTGVIIGIDLGTTNTCASYVDEGVPKIIPGRTGTNTIPSMITFEPDGSFHIGQRAADRQVMYPRRTIYGSKRLLGRTFRPDLADELQRHFAYPLAEAEGQRFGARIDDRVISMDVVAARVLDEVRSSAEEFLGVPVDAAVITVPAYFSEVQREAVRRAAGQAQLAVHRILNEPTAAAVAYGNKIHESARVAVWDFGGGTFDFSVVDTSDGLVEVLATGGDNFCGGGDFDDVVASYLLAEFQKSAGTEIEADSQQLARLRTAAEEAKHMLTTQDEHRVELMEFSRQPRLDLSVEITREVFDELVAPLIERTVAIAKEVMEAGDIDIESIGDVLLVGGTTRVPAVQRSVAKLFGRRPSKRINPDEAVALGAAILGDEVGKRPTLLDIIPMTVGRGVAHRRLDPIVPRHERLPVQKEIVLEADVLGTVTVPLFQGDAQDTSQNEYLCTVVVEDHSLWNGGLVRLVLSFDEHCVMTVEAFHQEDDRPLVVRLDRTRPVEEVLLDLGPFEGPAEEKWQPPETNVARARDGFARALGRRTEYPPGR